MEKTENYGDAFERLNGQLNSINVPVESTASPTESASPTPLSHLPPEASKFVFTFSPLYIYGGVPIIVLICFIMSQPDFLKNEVDENGEKKKKISFKKTILWTTIISVVINIVVFAYFYQKRKKNPSIKVI